MSRGERLFILAGAAVVVYLEVGTLKSYGVFLNDISGDINISTAVAGLAVGLSHGLAQGLGMGYGLVSFPSHMSLLEYFPDMFDITTSVIFTAGGLGMMTLPVAAEELRLIYGWRGAMLVMGGFSLHSLVACALFRPPGQQTAAESDPGHSGTSYRRLAEEGSSHSQQNVSAMCGGFSCLDAARALMNIELFQRHPASVIIVFASFFTGVTYSSWIIFVIPNALSKGIPAGEAVTLATIGGASNILGRFLVGFFSQAKVVPDHFTYAFIHVCATVAFFLNIAVDSFSLLAIMSVVNGFTCGAGIVLNSLLPKVIVQDSFLVAAISLAYLGLGIGEGIGGFLMGAVFDSTGSYNLAFAVAGLVDLSCGLLVLISVIVMDDYRYTVIEKVREMPLLWDPQHVDYKSKDQRQQAWDKLESDIQPPNEETFCDCVSQANCVVSKPCAMKRLEIDETISWILECFILHR
ncbi:monocarboxylate transporter 12-like [Diadema antillarum]|uniref:monocarboxylate transporter 12-like n=1 Tax=Diadema antillarum TaxID=105358 RepID=UPI003A84AD96